MGVLTYDALKLSIAGWLNRTDLTARIPDFITLLEARINRDIRWRKMIVRDVVIAPSIDEIYENLPSDFLELKEIRFNTNPPVEPEYCTPSRLNRLRALNPTATGTPRFYTITGQQIVFDRLATGGPELEIASYVKFPVLEENTQTTLLLIEHPDIYLYGSLLQAEPYLKNDERLQVWATLYGNAVDSLESADKKAETSPGPLVARPRKSL